MKYFLVALLAASALAHQYDQDNCNRSGNVCGNDSQTYHNACACFNAG